MSIKKVNENWLYSLQWWSLLWLITSGKRRHHQHLAPGQQKHNSLQRHLLSFCLHSHTYKDVTASQWICFLFYFIFCNINNHQSARQWTKESLILDTNSACILTSAFVLSSIWSIHLDYIKPFTYWFHPVQLPGVAQLIINTCSYAEDPHGVTVSTQSESGLGFTFITKIKSKCMKCFLYKKNGKKAVYKFLQ